MKTNILSTRRSLLMGLAAASATASLAHQGNSAVIGENPKLVALGDALPDVADAMDQAVKAKREAYDQAMSQWPDPAEEIVFRQIHGLGCAHDHERCIAGGARYKTHPEKGSKHVISAKYLQNRIEDAESNLAAEEKRSKPRKTRVKANREVLKRDRPLLLMAESYEAECGRIKREANYEAFVERASAATKTLQNHIDAIMDETSNTMLGVLIKAQALKRWEGVDWCQRVLNVRNVAWAEAMAKAVIDQAETG